MSWLVAAFGLLSLALLSGFVWYERAKPDAKLVALVGALAALGIVGRIAFAALPNVKPTTDIVLISGFALGGAPGFMVGATSALVSNFFFGQGPWTAWQMAGWGATGVAGAALGRVTGGRIGRRSLAAVCFVVGFAFTALQDVGDWVSYSDHSLGQLAAYVSSGLGFDLIDAVGCVGFALVFGPALTRSLLRFRQRMNVRWVPAAGGVATALVIAGVIFVGGLTLARPAAPARAAVRGATPVAYLVAAENRDGGWGPAKGKASTTLYTGWATLALAAAQVHTPAALRYLRTHAVGSDAGDIERTILAESAAGASPARSPVKPLVAALDRLVRRNRSVADQTNLTAFAILAMRAAGQRPSSKTLAWLAAQQDPDGGFNFGTRGAHSDVDDTGAAVEALAGSRYTKTIARAVKFITDQQNADGGFGYQPGAPSNAQSTAFALQGVIAVGVAPANLHRRGAASPWTYLQSLIQPDGAVDYAKGNAQTPVWVTAEAELALTGKPLPIRPMAAAPRIRHAA